MLTKDFDYNLPVELIAQKSVEPRDSSKMLVINKVKKTKEHCHFYDIVDFLRQGDLLVWNNSKVFKARLYGELEAVDDDINKDSQKDKSLFRAQKVEIFLIRPTENTGVWQVLAKPGRRVKPGMRVRFADDFYCDVVVKKRGGEILVQFPFVADKVREMANKYGNIPVPPYVKDEPHELEIYQTVYAKEEGSVAAPTAGFHFTDELIEKTRAKGVGFAEVTLHVGLGTFLPVKSEKVDDHTMHSEWVEVNQDTIDLINKTKQVGGRVFAVGTTTVRTLEGVYDLFGKLTKYEGDINIFIKPGFEFKVVDGMITNFHLPKSTLLMLVSAFVEDRDFILSSYREAVKKKYRFYSFGDAMLII